MLFLKNTKKNVAQFSLLFITVSLASVNTSHAQLATLLDFKDSDMFMRGSGWSKVLKGHTLRDVTAYKSLEHYLGGAEVFEDYQMNDDSEEALLNAEWKNLSIANLEVVDAYILTNHFIGVIPMLYDGQVETSMMPEVIDEATTFTPYYLLDRMNTALSFHKASQNKAAIESIKFSQKMKLTLARKLH